MRLKQLKNQWRVWLNPTDYARLRSCSESDAAHLSVRLGGECGLRVSESTAVTPNSIRDSTCGMYGHFLGVYGKDTSGDHPDGKYRDTFLPDNLYQILMRYIEKNDLDEEDELIPVTKRTTQEYIKRAALTAADRYDEPDYEKISSHDLRACWATDLLIRKGIKPEVLMAVGGWSSYDNMEPYLNAQFDDVIISAFNDIGIAQCRQRRPVDESITKLSV